MSTGLEATNRLNGTQGAIQSFTQRYPNERILHASAAILAPGWSLSEGPSILGRVVETRRGVLIVTPERIRFTCSPLAPISLMAALLIPALVALAYFSRDWVFLMGAVVLPLTILQRLPKAVELAWADIEAMAVRPVRAGIASGTTLAVRSRLGVFRFNVDGTPGDEVMSSIRPLLQESA